jgi:peptidyl-prolyl cis-trans isomerase C
MFKRSKYLARSLTLALSLSVAAPAMADTPDDQVCAEVTIEGKVQKITFGDLKKRLKSLPREVQGEKIEKIYDPLLQTAIQMLIISNNARKQSLDKDPEVQQRIKDCEEATVQKAYLDGEVDKLQTDVELKKAYDEAMKIMPDVDEVSFSQAVFRDKKRAEAFLTALKGNEGNFEKTLKEAQEKDPEVRGGDMDFTKIPELPPALAEALKNTKGGVVISKPIEEKLGKDSIFFTIKVKEKRKAKKPTFEEAKAELKGITMTKFVQDVIRRDSEGIKVSKFGLDGKPLEEKKEEKKEEVKTEAPKAEGKKEGKAEETKAAGEKTEAPKAAN